MALRSLWRYDRDYDDEDDDNDDDNYDVIWCDAHVQFHCSLPPS